MSELHFSVTGSVSERQRELLQEAERNRLVAEARQRPEKSGLRQQLGLGLMRLGQRLLGEVQLA